MLEILFLDYLCYLCVIKREKVLPFPLLNFNYQCANCKSINCLCKSTLRMRTLHDSPTCLVFIS